MYDITQLTMITVRRLPLSDQIIVLGADGKIAEQGHFNDLRSQEGFVNKIMLQPELLRSRSNETDMTEDSPTRATKGGAKALQGPTLSDATDLTRRLGDISVYKYYLRAIGWKIVVLDASWGVLFALGSNFPRELTYHILFLKLTPLGLWLTWYSNGTVTSLPLFASIYAVTAIVTMFSVAMFL